MQLSKLTAKEIRRIYRYKDLKPSTINKIHSTLRQALDDAVGKHSSTWVFPTAKGNPHYAANFYRHNWKPMLKKAGLPPITFHQLRHGAASYLLSQRVPIPAVSRFLGHANPSITLSVYSHMIEGDEGIAGSAIDSILA
jgi:integrase